MADIKVPQARHADAAVGSAASVFDPLFPYYPQDRGLDLLGIGRALRRDYPLILTLVGFATLLALIVGFAATPVYRAEALLSPVAPSRNEGLGGVIGQLGDLGVLLEGYVGSGKDRTAESLATLRSRSLAMEFIREHDIKRHLFRTRWDAARARWRADMPVPTDLEAFTVFNEVRSVHVDRRTGLVSLAIEWDDPLLAANWTNALIRQVNERRRAEAIGEARQSIDYLQKQAAKTSSVEILQAIYRLIEAQTKTITIASAREEYAFKVIDRAVTPEKRVRPHRTMMAVIGALLGLLTAIAVVLFRHGLRRRRLLGD
jgi:uncharacterized protein involved in exopolysaccharide biosynthesis